MKFVKEGFSSKRHCNFEDVDLGGIFFQNGNAYMAINCEDITEERYGDCPAVNLGTGIIEFFNDNEPVTILDKELEISYKDEDLREWTDD